jgi:hypothetical protein
MAHAIAPAPATAAKIAINQYTRLGLPPRAASVTPTLARLPNLMLCLPRWREISYQSSSIGLLTRIKLA